MSDFLVLFKFLLFRVYEKEKDKIFELVRHDFFILYVSRDVCEMKNASMKNAKKIFFMKTNITVGTLFLFFKYIFDFILYIKYGN